MTVEPFYKLYTAQGGSIRQMEVYCSDCRAILQTIQHKEVLYVSWRSTVVTVEPFYKLYTAQGGSIRQLEVYCSDCRAILQTPYSTRTSDGGLL